MSTSLVIDPRFNGPEHSANGGYACGCVAERLEAAGHPCVRVNLRAPPPLGRPLALELHEETRTELRDPSDDRLIADADAARCEIELPSPPSFDEAKELSTHYTGFVQHALPHCFVCGPKRSPDDGLLIHPGRDPKHPTAPAAAPWTPHPAFGEADGAVHRRVVWAALDCPGYFGVAEPGELALLASMTGRVDHRPKVGERCVVLGWSLGREGRKLRAATAAFGQDGRVLGFSEQLWVQIRPA